MELDRSLTLAGLGLPALMSASVGAYNTLESPYLLGDIIGGIPGNYFADDPFTDFMLANIFKNAFNSTLPDYPDLNNQKTPDNDSANNTNDSDSKSDNKNDNRNLKDGSTGSETLQEALKDYDAERGKELSESCEDLVGNDTPHGECPKGPSHALAKEEGTHFSANGGDWGKLDDLHPDKWKEVEVSVSDLDDLPAGCLVNYDRGSTIGHIVMADGNGGGNSDGHEAQLSNDPSAKITVLIPIA